MMTLPFLMLLLTAAGEGGVANPAMDDPRLNDARLNGVCFASVEQGWAVGDRGVVWHTDDGGKHWQLQTSGVSCRLSSVYFRDENLGWAVGGFTQPYSHAGVGVVLLTRDGGKTWQNLPRLVLPPLRRVGFFDNQHGWAVGCRSAMYPSGAFVTDDAGRGWRPLAGSNEAGWLGGEFLNMSTGAVVGGNGTFALVRNGEITAQSIEGAGLRSLAQLQLADARRGWLIGDGGLVMTTADRGAAWQPPQTELPPAAKCFDFAAIAVRGERCWIAGSPGSRVFFSGDAGQTWSAFSTGFSTPIRSMAFASDTQGWAVGDLGAILATNDGGQTWQRQRSGGVRAAMLGVFSDPEDAPLELIARLGGNEGYLAAVEVLGRRDIEVRPSDDIPVADRLHEAVANVGGASTHMAWQFPLRQAGLFLHSQAIVEAWDRVHDGRGLDALQEYVVRQICTWRPDVIVTHNSGQPDRSALDAIVRQVVVKAMIQAADADGFSKRFVEAGLEPWRVQRIYSSQPPGNRGSIDVSTSQLAQRLGASLADAAAEPRGLIQPRPETVPPVLGYQMLANDATPNADRRDFFSGIPLPPGGDARRAAPPGSANTAEAFLNMQRLAQRRQHIRAILDQSDRMGASPEQLLAKTNDLIRDVDESIAGQMLFHQVDRFRRSGRWLLAADLAEVMMEQYPDHPLASQVRLWLVQYDASEEAAHRTGCNEARRQQRYQQAIELGQTIERTRPEWFAEPRLQFPLAVACRNLNQLPQAERYYLQQSRRPDQDAWKASAQSELHLAFGKGPAAKPLQVCIHSESRPHLDGELDDAVWQRAKPIPLQSAQHDDGDWPCEIRLARDAEFLYVAAHCRRGDGWTPLAPPPAGARPRDGDLSAHDRVEILLDLDRDGVTFYRLAVDDRGWTNDSWWGSSDWEPKWFVAASRTEDGWTFEAAIPFDQMMWHAPRSHDVWCVGLQRVVPGVGFQSWTTPAAVEPIPEGLGHLRFE
jgi:photosystem II stability/assembly factor-like uncharacterized protein